MKPRIRSHARFFFPLSSALAALVASPCAHSVPIWWDGGTGNWNTLSAWTTSVSATTPDASAVPGINDDLTFNRAGNNATNNTVSLAGGSRLAKSITFSTSGTSIFRANASGTTTARTLTIGAGGITVNVGAGAVTIGENAATYGAVNVPLNTSQTWSNNSTSLLTVNGIVSGGFDLTKSGTGQIRLNGVNSHTGATIVNGGDLLIGNYSGLNSTSGITISGGNASLQLVQVGTGSTSNTINKPVSLHGTLRTAGGSGTNLLSLTWSGNVTLAGAGTIWNNGNSTLDIDGQIDLGTAALTFQADRDGSRIDGAIIGTGSFIKSGLRNLTLSGSNSFSGDITVNAGTLIGTGATNSPGVPVFGARSNTRTITINTGGTLQFNSGNILGATHAATTAPTLVINSGGVVTTGGSATNNALNNIEINGGTLTATTGSASGYGAWNLNGTVTSTGASTISTSDAVNGTVMLKVAGTTNFDVVSGTLSVSAPLTDNMNDLNTGALGKSGVGTMVLSAANTYTGTTAVTAGTLAFSGSGSSNTSSGITVNGADAKLLQTSSVPISPVVTLTQGTLTGSGTLNTVNVGDATGGIVSNNDGVAGAAITIGALTFNGAATVNTFSSGTSAPIVTTSLASNAAGIVTINPTAASWAIGTPHDLISYGGGSIGGAGFTRFALGTIPGVSPRQSKTFADSGSAITLTIGADDVPYWAGDGDGKWNLASTQNWKLSSDSSYTAFLSGDNVLFNDNATGAGPIAVDIDTANVATLSTTFNNPTKDYLLGGAFGISSGSLTKSGSGDLTITNANSYTGNTTITGGVLDLSTDGAQLYSGATPVTAMVTVGSGAVLVVRNFGQANTSGAGSPSLGNLNNSGGQVVIDGGTLRFKNETTARGRVINVGPNGATLDVVNNSTYTWTTSPGTSVPFSGTGQTLTLTGDETSTGQINLVIGGTDVSLVKNGAATWTLGGNNTYTGNTTLSAGVLAMSGNKIPNSPTIFIGNGATLQSTGNFSLAAGQDITGTGATGNVLHTTPGTSGFLTTGDTTISTSGTLTFSRLDVRGTGNVISGGAILSGGAAASQRGLLVGNTVSGDLTLNAGASLTTGASGTNSQDILGNGTATGTLIINGGTYTNTSGLATLQLGNAASNGGALLTVNSGSARIGSLAYQVGASQSGIVNLNGGTLTLGNITSNAAGTREFNFDGGQFVASGGVTFPADVTTNVKNGGAKIDTNGFSATVASSMANFGGTSTGGLTKSGLGTLTLSGNNTYTGGTSVTGGKLRFSTAAASATDVTVAGGSEAGALVAANDAQWLNAGDLNLQANGAAIVDYGSTTPSTSVAPISVVDFTQSATPGVRLAGASIHGLQVGTTYPLVTWSGTGPLDGSTFTLLTHRLTGNFTIASNTLSLTVTSNATNAPISWNTGNGTWDTSSIHWLASNLTSTTYVDTLDTVEFGDATGATGNPAVSLASTVSPVGVTVNTTGRNYTVAGAGSISGSGGLVLAGTNTGTFTLATANNTFSGGTSVLGGTLTLGHATDTLPDSGTVTVDGSSAILSLGANTDTVGLVSLKNDATITGSGGTLTGSSYALESGSVSAILGGSGNLTKTTAGTVILSGANTYTGTTTVNAGTLVLSNTGALQGTTGSVGFAIGTALQLSTDTAFTNLPPIGVSSGASAVTFISDRATAGAGLTHGLGTPVFGANTFNFTSGANVTGGTAGISLNSLGLTSGGSGTTVLNPTTATVTITGGVTSQANNVTRTLQLDGTGTGHSIGGVITQSVASALSLAKSNTSTWTLSGANTYNGTTTIDQGTLVFNTTDQTLSGGLTFGAAAGSANNGTLDLSTASATFAGAALVRTNSATANTITLGVGKTLTLNGGLTVGYDPGSGSTTSTKLTVDGGGSLAVNGTTISIGQGLAANNVAWTNTGTVDVTSLASFSANVTNFNLGVGATDGTGSNGILLLSNTANTLIATTLKVGDTLTENGGGGNTTLTLGTGTNVIQANTIEIGKGKGSGPAGYRVAFASQTAGSPGTVTISDKAGSGAATINIANMGSTGTGGTVVASLDLRGHASTVNASALLIANSSNGTGTNVSGSNGTVHFDSGTFTVGTLNMGLKSGISTGTATGTVNVGGGSFTVNTAFTLGSHSGGGASNATLNITGGTFTSNVNILKGSSTASGTINLDGGTLDMTGKNIGSTNTVTLNAKSGTLSNVAAINGTGGLTKTTAGTLVLAGTIGYSGPTTISAGTLALAASTSIATSPSVNLDAAGTLDTSAQPTYVVPATQPVTISIDPTDTGSSGKIAAAGLDISTAVVTLNPTATLDDPVYVLATYTSLTGSVFSSVTGVPSGYHLVYNHDGNKIALVQSVANNYASWASLNGVAGGPNGDDDNDGVSNLVEYALADGQERGTLTGTSLSFTKRGAPYGGDLTYEIETSENLGASDPWTPVTPTANNATTISFTLENPGDNFARLKVTKTP